jgi:hypothetical protein
MSKTLVLAAALLTGINALAQKLDVDTIVYNGISDKRINLVILSDGYTVNEISKFITDANNFTTGFFNDIPFSNYKNYFNVFIIKVPSNQSGASHPGTATDGTVEPGGQPVVEVDNYFGSTFDFGGIHRLLVATKTSVISNVLASNFPDYDQALILVNSPYYGGSGGYYTVASTNTSSTKIAVHELGHSFSGLKDEYWAGDIYAAEGINMTKQTDLLLVRWKNWIGANGIGVYQHSGSTIASQWYRPHQNCLMRYLGVPFCSVCIQGTVEKIHSLVTPLESYFPLDNNQTPLTYPSKFKLNLIAPLPNTLKRYWLLNGSFLKRNIDSVFINENNFVSGLNTLNVTIEDTTQFLRVDNHSTIHVSSVSWSINKIVTGIKNITGSSSEYIIEIYPNPASDLINIKLTGETGGKIRLELYDLQGKKQKVRSLSNSDVNSIDLNGLNQGVYVAKIFINNKLITTRKIIRK